MAAPVHNSISIPATSYDYALAVTASDSVAFSTNPCRALYIGGAGSLTVLQLDGTTATFVAVAGGIIPIRTTRVNATGLTATGVVALW